MTTLPGCGGRRHGRVPSRRQGGRQRGQGNTLVVIIIAIVVFIVTIIFVIVVIIVNVIGISEADVSVVVSDMIWEQSFSSPSV